MGLGYWGVLSSSFADPYDGRCLKEERRGQKHPNPEAYARKIKTTPQLYPIQQDSHRTAVETVQSPDEPL